MRGAVASLVTLALLGGCAQSKDLSNALASRELPLGYPVYVNSTGEECRYQVQDMIFIRDSQLDDWMRDIDKTWQIDLVTDAPGERCLSKALGIVRNAGFKSILLRESEGLSYPKGGPPA